MLVFWLLILGSFIGRSMGHILRLFILGCFILGLFILGCFILGLRFILGSFISRNMRLILWFFILGCFILGLRLIFGSFIGRSMGLMLWLLILVGFMAEHVSWSMWWCSICRNRSVRLICISVMY